MKRSLFLLFMLACAATLLLMTSGCARPKTETSVYYFDTLKLNGDVELP